MVEFQKFAKIPRLYREMVVTEKIDGTNAAIGIKPIENGYKDFLGFDEREGAKLVNVPGGYDYLVYAQSRKRIITPEQDNYGFARLVYDNAEQLIEVLGPGLHFGEYWGSGINRGYGFADGTRMFSLFNVSRWSHINYYPVGELVLSSVPILYEGEFNTQVVSDILNDLKKNGSEARPGYERPEGVVVYHKQANFLFKATIENDQLPKEVAAQFPDVSSLTFTNEYNGWTISGPWDAPVMTMNAAA